MSIHSLLAAPGLQIDDSGLPANFIFTPLAYNCGVDRLRIRMISRHLAPR